MWEPNTGADMRVIKDRNECESSCFGRSSFLLERFEDDSSSSRWSEELLLCTSPGGVVLSRKASADLLGHLEVRICSPSGSHLSGQSDLQTGGAVPLWCLQVCCMDTESCSLPSPGGGCRFGSSDQAVSLKQTERARLSFGRLLYLPESLDKSY